MKQLLLFVVFHLKSILLIYPWFFSSYISSFKHQHIVQINSKVYQRLKYTKVKYTKLDTIIGEPIFPPLPLNTTSNHYATLENNYISEIGGKIYGAGKLNV